MCRCFYGGKRINFKVGSVRKKLRNNFIRLRDEGLLIWRRKIGFRVRVVVSEKLLGGGDKKGKIIVNPKRVRCFCFDLMLGEEVEVIGDGGNGGGVKKRLGDGVKGELRRSVCWERCFPGEVYFLLGGDELRIGCRRRWWKSGDGRRDWSRGGCKLEKDIDNENN